MKRAVAQFLGGRQAEASTTAESMVEPWNVGCCSAAAAARRVLGWWYSTFLQYSPVRVRFWITFRGRARGRGKGLPRGSRWRSLAWLTWPSKKKARSFRSGGSFAQGRERYGNSHSHGHSHPSAQGAVRCKQCLFSAIISDAKPHSLTGHASQDTLRHASPDTLHFTR